LEPRLWEHLKEILRELARDPQSGRKKGEVEGLGSYGVGRLRIVHRFTKNLRGLDYVKHRSLLDSEEGCVIRGRQ
jgi:hypothetical protein